MLAIGIFLRGGDVLLGDLVYWRSTKIYEELNPGRMGRSAKLRHLDQVVVIFQSMVHQYVHIPLATEKRTHYH